MQENPPETPGFTASLAQAAALTDRTLAALMDRIEAQALTAGRKRLAAAMRHATLGGGKRVRPFLALTAARCLSPGNASVEAAALKAAIAVELIHCYSLVHDDMPAMDNDLMRRGMPTVHALHGDAVAILAGDALQTLAFETLGEIEDPALGLALVRVLSRASGEAGMVGGQMLDLHAEGRFASETRETPEAERRPLALSLDGIAEVQSLKTGAIIIAAAEMGALCGGAAVGSPLFEALSRYARISAAPSRLRTTLLTRRGMPEQRARPWRKMRRRARRPLFRRSALMGRGRVWRGRSRRVRRRWPASTKRGAHRAHPLHGVPEGVSVNET